MIGISRERWDTLRHLLDAALELEPEERSRWLDTQRRTDPALAAEVEALLGREGLLEAEGFLDAGRRPVEPATLGSLEGTSLGPWRLERQIGQGGMGSVWLARRSDGRFEGAAAIKFLSLAMAGSSGEARFRREGSVLARLSHPNIARLLDAGVTPAGQPYLVLEHVDGTPIDAWCRERRLGIEARLRLFLQVVEAVAHAHANLIVHRDLKPANILVTADGRVKLLDFGIAKLLEEGGDGAAHTAAEERLLTLEFAAPEQIRGTVVSTATDVYALGVVLYQLLAGAHPTSPGARTPAEQIRGVLEQEPARLPAPLAGDLDTVLALALRKEPAERYQTVAAFGADLERYLRHEPVSARPATWRYRAAKFVRRNRGAVGTAALVFLALLITTGMAISQLREARRQRDAALRASRWAEAQAEFQQLLISEVGDRPMTMRAVLDTARVLLAHQAGGDQRLRAGLLLQLIASYSEMGETSVRDTLVTLAESLAVATNDSLHLAQARCERISLLRKQGRYDQAWSAWPGTEQLALAVGDPAQIADCYTTYSILAVETHHPEQGLPAARRAVQIRDSLGLTRDKDYLDILDNYAYALDALGRSREAAAIERRELAAMDSTGRSGMLDGAVMWHNYALTLQGLGETALAESLLQRALERFQRTDPSDQPTWQVVIHYAEGALAQGHGDSALKYFGVIADRGVREGLLYWEGRGLFGKGRALVRLGRLEEAKRARDRLAKVIELYPDVRDTEDQLPDAHVLTALILLAGGHAAAAKTEAVSALRANGYFEGKDRRRLRPVVLLAGEAALAAGDVAAALQYAREARAIAAIDSVAATESGLVGEAELLEGRALLARGDTLQARATISLAFTALRHGAGEDHAETVAARALLAALDGR